MNTERGNYEYLQERLEGLTSFEKDRVHYSVVGGTSVHVDSGTWKRIVDSAIESLGPRVEVAS